MNRRKFFGLLAAIPFAVKAAVLRKPDPEEVVLDVETYGKWKINPDWVEAPYEMSYAWSPSENMSGPLVWKYVEDQGHGDFEFRNLGDKTEFRRPLTA